MEGQARTEVIVTDIQMTFWSMVVFMVKWTVAAIPAFLILFLLGLGLAALGAGFVASLGL
ncbi:MAG: hypothetical protein WEA09_02295 [Gemmatimonadota bacterium]